MLINVSNSIEIDIDRSNPVLNIDQLNPKLHSGNYSCGAYNSPISHNVSPNSISVIIES